MRSIIEILSLLRVALNDFFSARKRVLFIRKKTSAPRSNGCSGSGANCYDRHNFGRTGNGRTKKSVREEDEEAREQIIIAHKW